MALYCTGTIAALLFLGVLWNAISAPSLNPMLDPTFERLGAADTTGAIDSATVAVNVNDVKALAQSGDHEAQYRLAKALFRENTLSSDAESLAEGVASLRAAANGGHPAAQSEMGDLYLDGRGVVQDFVQATAWYRKAADQGNSKAMLGLGRMARSGWGIEADLVEAYVWLNLASARGEADAIQARKEIITQLSAAQLNAAQVQSRELDQRIP